MTATKKDQWPWPVTQTSHREERQGSDFFAAPLSQSASFEFFHPLFDEPTEGASLPDERSPGEHFASFSGIQDAHYSSILDLLSPLSEAPIERQPDTLLDLASVCESLSDTEGLIDTPDKPFPASWVDPVGPMPQWDSMEFPFQLLGVHEPPLEHDPSPASIEALLPSWQEFPAASPEAVASEAMEPEAAEPPPFEVPTNAPMRHTPTLELTPPGFEAPRSSRSPSWRLWYGISRALGGPREKE